MPIKESVYVPHNFSRNRSRPAGLPSVVIFLSGLLALSAALPGSVRPAARAATAFTVNSTADYPQTMAAEQFVDSLNSNGGGALSQAGRDALVAQLAGGARTRAQALRAVAEDADLNAAEKNKAFVLMQYFGYLRRDPDAAPDADFSGYNFWLGKLNEFGGDFIRAGVVKAFLDSTEYRNRFGQ